MSLEEIVPPVIARAMAEHPDRAIVVGLCGAQGSGKSTLAAALCERLEGTVTLSLDDLYLTRTERLRLAEDVHPLLRTRGVPGTHDLGLGLRVVDAVLAGEQVALPRFSKAIDDRLPKSAWPVAPATTRVLLLEGWCVGARPQDLAALAEPTNDLERAHDANGVWRRYVNDALAGPYQALFDRIDTLILIAAPAWDAVLQWRIEQEHMLRRTAAGAVGVMDDAAVQVFVSHYERLTCHILAEMPGRSDLIIWLDRHRMCRSYLTR